MQKLKLGATDIAVSEFCLGSMTWGSQNSEPEGHAQIDRALDRGIDFIDTAELYPVNPIKKETIGVTETILGNWFAKTGRRKDVVLATKCAGINANFVREDIPVSGATLRQALEGSLKRLQTEYIDLYQLHGPNRGSYHFRKIWEYDPSTQSTQKELDHFADVMETLAALKKEGKIRAFGLSNETAWGTMQWNAAAAATGGPRITTMQNEYSLLCRLYDGDMAEMSVHENITLLAYSPLAVGLLTGKYQNNNIPAGSRLDVTPGLGGRVTDRVFPAVAAYLAIAQKHGLHPVHLALAWTRSRPVTTIPIFGATSIEQLDTALDGVGLSLGQDVLDDIAAAHKAHPMPY
ncbi:aldo/keto reductase [Oceaniglobus ichthyenteri]|uniref:aldo/keto reductase n=1 Tax=Oceaniglobus ichthyenteri TaxID=2136177 RepID=UPI000D37AA1A|nr:aldo/keto reductase [Oceaniglobus ichthyenteri]